MWFKEESAYAWIPTDKAKISKTEIQTHASVKQPEA